MMKKEQMVGTRLPASLVADLEEIERTEQTDRSATLRMADSICRLYARERSARTVGQPMVTVGPQPRFAR